MGFMCLGNSRMPSYVPVKIFVTTIFALSMFFYLIEMSFTTWIPGLKLNNVMDEHKETLDDRIYLWETSGRSSLNYRQSCAVESAARQNPDRPVRLYMAAKEVNYTSRSIQLLNEYSNVVIEAINLDEYFNNTLLERWYHDGKWKTSPHNSTHLSDYLRILTVYKGGGQYLDLDFVVTKSLNELRNYVVLESDHYICNGVFHFEENHVLVEKMIKKLASQYDPGSWASHGPFMVSHVIYSNCNVTAGLATGPKCGSGVSIFNASMFLPLPYTQWTRFFHNQSSDELPDELHKAYGIHMWNRMSVREPVLVGSSQYYALLASRYCPLSYAAALHKFKK